jgi:hypothetical protein
MEVKIKKLTDVDLLREAASFTSGNECHMSLKTAYRNQHSIIRTQLFWVEMTDIPLFVASQLVRSHIGLQFYQRSKRVDRGGLDFTRECQEIRDTIVSECMEDDMPCAATVNRITELPKRYDRMAPTDVAGIMNAEAIINMSHKRLCTKASPETRALWREVKLVMMDADPDLAVHMVPACFYRGGLCGEPRSCRYTDTEKGKLDFDFYKTLFKDGTDK